MREKLTPEEISNENLMIAEDLKLLYEKHKDKNPVLASDAKQAYEFYLSQAYKK